MTEKSPLVHYRDEMEPTSCPYGDVTRVVTFDGAAMAVSTTPEQVVEVLEYVTTKE